jgi:hypothetical protein
MKIIVFVGALSAMDWFTKPTAGSTFIVEVLERTFCKTSGVMRSYEKNICETILVHYSPEKIDHTLVGHVRYSC